MSLNIFKRIDICEWFGHNLINTARYTVTNVHTNAPAFEQTFWVCVRCDKQYDISFNHQDKQLRKFQINKNGEK